MNLKLKNQDLETTIAVLQTLRNICKDEFTAEVLHSVIEMVKNIDIKLAQKPNSSDCKA